MRISDWSSDVCSSDLCGRSRRGRGRVGGAWRLGDGALEGRRQGSGDGIEPGERHHRAERVDDASDDRRWKAERRDLCGEQAGDLVVELAAGAGAGGQDPADDEERAGAVEKEVEDRGAVEGKRVGWGKGVTG